MLLAIRSPVNFSDLTVKVSATKYWYRFPPKSYRDLLR